MIRTLLLSAAVCAQSFSAMAAPKVVTDIPPVQSLVSSLMTGVATPSLLLDGAGSPHDQQLRPSKAAALQAADLVIIVSDHLSHAVERQIAALSGDAKVIELIDLAKDRQLKIDHEDEHGDAHEAEHGDDHEGHDEHEDHAEDHGDDHSDHEAHDDHADEIDPHAWLDVGSVKIWVTEVAQTLTQMDPENGDVYAVNLATVLQDLDLLSTEIAAMDLSGSFIAYHDSLAYFGRINGATGLPIVGHITDHEAAAPTAKHLRGLGGLIAQKGVTCVLAEPGYDKDLIGAVVGSQSVKTVELDILGQRNLPDATSYLAMMRALIADITTCGAK